MPLLALLVPLIFNVDVNMEGKKTPKKAVIKKTYTTCRLCNKDLDQFRVDLFGNKSNREGILTSLQEICDTSEIHQDDGLPRYLCRQCASNIVSLKKKMLHFKSLYKETESANLRELEKIRFKRARGPLAAVELSPSSCRVQKRSSLGPNRARQINLAPTFTSPQSSLAKTFESVSGITARRILPKPRSAKPLVLEECGSAKRTADTSTTSNQAPTKQRVLPASLKPKVPSLQLGAEILESAGLHNTKVSDVENFTNHFLDSQQKEDICREVMKGSPSTLSKVIMEIPKVSNCVKGLIMGKIDEQCTKLCSKTNPSVLRAPRLHHKEIAKTFSWPNILKEMRERAPDVLDILTTVAAPNTKHDGRQVPPICTAYSVLMNTRNRELSLVQKINTVVLGAGHATEKTFQRLSKLGITQSRDNYRNLMDDIGGDFVADIKQNKKPLRLVCDNFDFKVLVNITLKNHKNSDMHWMAQYVTFDRVPSSLLDDTRPLISDIDKFENKEYLLSQDELQKMKSDFTILVARVLVDFFSCLEYLRKDVSAHIPHRYSEEMATKSTIIGLPILPYNQSKVSDVCQYLDHTQNFLLSTLVDNPQPYPAGSDEDLNYKEAILKDVKLPLCGDLLGRERITGAKKTRLGCDHNFERFNNIIEYPALWHTKQSFLVYIWEQLFKTSSGREIGTLFFLKQRFRMTNVYTSVKKNYKSAENLMLSATKAYLCCAFMKWAGIKGLEGTPTEIKLPNQESSHEEKNNFLMETIGRFVDEFVLVEFDIEKAWREQREQKQAARQQEPPTPQPTGIPVPHLNQLNPGQAVVLVYPKPEGGYKVVGVGQVCVLEQQQTESLDHIPVVVISVEPDANTLVTINVGQVIYWPKSWIAIPSRPTENPSPLHDSHEKERSDQKKPLSSSQETQEDDKFFNYGLQCIQLGVLLMQLNDTEKEGDGSRSVLNWKLLMLYFRARQRGTKYAFEAMRFITHVKALYTEQTAHRIVHGQFVNPKGGCGNNYANDLKMEMQVKNHKVILKGMCGNKSLKAVERSSAATHGLKKIVDTFDNDTNISPESTSHTSPSTQDDIKEMITILDSAKPFEFTPGRTLRSFPSITKSPLDQIDTALLHTWLSRHKRRLARNAFACCDDWTDEDLEEECSDDEEEELLDEMFEI